LDTQGYLSINFSDNYYYLSQRHPEVPRLTEQHVKAINAFNEIAGSEKLRMDYLLEPGDIELLNNHICLHTRSSFVDDVVSISSQAQQQFVRKYGFSVVEPHVTGLSKRHLQNHPPPVCVGGGASGLTIVLHVLHLITGPMPCEVAQSHLCKCEYIIIGQNKSAATDTLTVPFLLIAH
jgi:hypothetical protein